MVCVDINDIKLVHVNLNMYVRIANKIRMHENILDWNIHSVAIIERKALVPTKSHGNFAWIRNRSFWSSKLSQTVSLSVSTC